MERSYIAIDLKSFYASVECVERGLNPLKTNLVVADPSRTEKTICLAVSPSLKAYGIPGRARLFEVIQRVREVNRGRKPGEPELTFLTAPPRMSLYLDYSARIYRVYLRYIAPEDIHVYSIDEVFLDVTAYLHTYKMTARQLAKQMIREVYRETGITAAAGIGTNLYLCKVAMDIVAKHVEADQDGVRVAELDERTYRELLWDHRPLTDFWRVGSGYARKLEQNGLFTMGDIARCSLGKDNEFYNEDLLYRLFGINAELLIDHAWGWEPVTIADIKAYKPETNSLCSGQVLQSPYDFQKARLVVREMTELLVMDLVGKGLVTDQIVLTLGYDVENLKDPERRRNYHGEITVDRYGREVPKHAHGTANLGGPTSSTRKILEKTLELFDRIAAPQLLVRRLNVTANHLLEEKSLEKQPSFEQMELFRDFGMDQDGAERENEKAFREREKKMQQAVLDIQSKYGRNAVLKGADLTEGATTRERNLQIGGHKA